MKLAIYGFVLFLVIAILLPRALSGGRHQVTSAVLRKNETLDTPGDNQVLQTKAREQDQTQRQEILG